MTTSKNIINEEIAELIACYLADHLGLKKRFEAYLKSSEGIEHKARLHRYFGDINEFINRLSKSSTFKGLRIKNERNCLDFQSTIDILIHKDLLPELFDPSEMANIKGKIAENDQADINKGDSQNESITNDINIDNNNRTYAQEHEESLRNTKTELPRLENKTLQAQSGSSDLESKINQKDKFLVDKVNWLILNREHTDRLDLNKSEQQFVIDQWGSLASFFTDLAKSIISINNLRESS